MESFFAARNFRTNPQTPVVSEDKYLSYGRSLGKTFVVVSAQDY